MEGVELFQDAHTCTQMCIQLALTTSEQDENSEGSESSQAIAKEKSLRRSCRKHVEKGKGHA
jgi:hypothetical protein